jgi:hypothetical protein
MIREITDKFVELRPEFGELLSNTKMCKVSHYVHLLEICLRLLNNADIGYKFYVDRLCGIDSDEYEGTILFIITDKEDNFWYIRQDYGSCSACDTLLEIQSSMSSLERYSDAQVKDLWLLSLHMMQNMKVLTQKQLKQEKKT